MPTTSASSDFPVLVYDGDCAFCTTVVVLLRRRLRPPVQFLPWQQIELDRYGLTEAEVLSAVQWIGSDGRRYAGAQAFGALLRAKGGWCWPIGAALRLPGIRQVAALGYRLIAANRHRLPGGTAACALNPPPRS